jgi:hypothetical protein
MGHRGVKLVTPENVTLRELVRTNDLVLVSALGALLDGAGIFHRCWIRT